MNRLKLFNSSKPTQLALHAALGATTASLMKGNLEASTILSGAAAGAIGELAADSAYREGSGSFSKEGAITLGQLSGATASLFTSLASGVSDEEAAGNIGIGSFVGGNAAVNNAISAQFHEVKSEKINTASSKDESDQVKLGVFGVKIGEIEVGLNGELEIGDYSIKLNSDQTLELSSGSYHGSWLIVPDNQELWQNHPDFQNNLTADGKVYATVGGGPDQPFEILREIPNLHGGINRAPHDINLSNKVLTIQIPPSVIGNEDLKIQQLLNLNANFEANPNKLNYWLFPDKNNNFYNSNSYMAGIGQTANLPIPQINLKVPGYDKPVPREYFQPN